MGPGVDAGVLGREDIVSGDLLLSAVELGVGVCEVFVLLGIFLRLVKLGFELHDRRGSDVGDGAVLLGIMVDSVSSPSDSTTTISL